MDGKVHMTVFVEIPHTQHVMYACPNSLARICRWACRLPCFTLYIYVHCISEQVCARTGPHFRPDNTKLAHVNTCLAYLIVENACIKMHALSK